jgi:hypothetical protein
LVWARVFMEFCPPPSGKNALNKAFSMVQTPLPGRTSHDA